MGPTAAKSILYANFHLQWIVPREDATPQKPGVNSESTRPMVESIYVRMITPPPIITAKRRSPWIIPSLILAAGLSIGYVFFRGIFTAPAITEDDHLQKVKETPVTLRELGFMGSVIANRRNTLTLYTADEESTFYSTPWRIMNLAGPNKLGHLIVFEINQATDEYRFILVDFNSGTTKVADKGVGDVIWNHVVGEMAMHPNEDKVVYFSGTGNRQYPGAYMETGKLIELDLTTQSKSELANEVVENKFTFSATGSSIFYTRSTADAEPQIAQKILKTGVVKSLGTGWSCSLSFDSNSLVVFDQENAPARSLNLKSGVWKSLERNAYYFWPLATLSDSLVLAESLPLTKETARYFPPTGSISGAHLMMRLGVFEPKKQRAAILRTDLDRYEPVASSGQTLTAKAFKTKL